MNVLMIYPEFPDTFWSFRHALKFIDKKAGNPPLGLITIAAMLPKHWQKRLVDLNIEPLTEEAISWADWVMVSAMVVQRDSTHEVITRVAKQLERPSLQVGLFSRVSTRIFHWWIISFSMKAKLLCLCSLRIGSKAFPNEFIRPVNLLI